MKFDILTIFPKMFEGPFNEGLVGQAIKEKRLTMEFWNPRVVSSDVHKTVDDRPYGGGDGMVMLPEVLKKTLELVPRKNRNRVVYLSCQGPRLTQAKAKQLSEYEQLILVCGRYGGVDQRFIDKYVDEEISIGDYVLSGGELAAMTLMDAVSRYIPGVLGNPESVLNDTFGENLLEHPLYTRPREFEGQEVPEVLLSGNHERIKEWQKSERVRVTLEKRPDLLSRSSLTKTEINQACKTLKKTRNLAVGLVHYPVYNKVGEVVATNVTNLDIHDIARACRTYGIDQFYIITPAEEQLAFVARVLEHWQSGRGIQYNPVRKDSLVNTKSALSVEAALEDWKVEGTQVIATSARRVSGPKAIGFEDASSLALKTPIFLLFGTGWGLENSLVRKCDYLLDPIQGRSPDGFRHLSVRSAVSIILDRLFGSTF